MHNYLVFQLYGPMAAWGEIAVGELRHSAQYPSKSALIGLIAAALGIKRSEEQQQTQLAASLRFGLQVFSAGSLVRDYHTTQVPPQERKRTYYTREQEINHAAKLNTILSTRDYRADGYVLVALSLTEQSQWTLEEIADALKTPVFTLYLGRKSCPLATPLDVQWQRGVAGLKAAFAGYQRKKLSFAKDKGDNWLPLAEPFFAWEGEAGDLKPELSKTRHDQPLSRKRWQFGPRQEHICYHRSE